MRSRFSFFVWGMGNAVSILFGVIVDRDSGFAGILQALRAVLFEGEEAESLFLL